MSLSVMICAEKKDSGRMVVGVYEYTDKEALAKDIATMHNFTRLAINDVETNPEEFALLALMLGDN